MEKRRFWWQLCPVLLYTLWFLTQVRGLAARHLDEEVFIPEAVCLLGGAWLLLVLADCFRTRRFSMMRCLGPLACLAAGVLNLMIGLHTPCCSGG